jgi:threonine dehydratase
VRIPDFLDITAAAARLQGRVRRTPLVSAAWLSEVSGARVWLKLENQQLEGSFKIRGAFNALLASPVAAAVTASAGNHGRALAFAAHALDVPLTVFVPRTAPRAKQDFIRRHGATLELCDSYDEAEIRARAFAQERGVPYISPYNNADVIAGAGTVALEVFDEAPEIDALIVPVGGGGLVSGTALVAGGYSSSPSVTGVEAAASPVFTTALSQGKLVDVEVRPTLADGLAGNAEPGSITFDLVRDHEVQVVAADEQQIELAMRELLRHQHQVVEGAGAAGVAALLAGTVGVAGRRVAVIVSGGNVDARAVGSTREKPPSEQQQDERQHGPEHH